MDIDQLNSGLEKMNLNNENIKNLISLRKNDIIKENDFIDGIKKIILEISVLENKLKENEKNNSKIDTIKYEFQLNSQPYTSWFLILIMVIYGNTSLK